MRMGRGIKLFNNKKIQQALVIQVQTFGVMVTESMLDLTGEKEVTWEH